MTHSFFRMLLVAGATSALAHSAAFAQAGGEAAIETGASYSSLRGGLAFIGVSADDLLGSGLDFRLGYQAGEDGEALSATTSKTFSFGSTALGEDTFARATLNARTSDWSSQAYALETYRASVEVGAETLSGFRYTGRLFWQQDSVDDFSDDVSPLAAIPLDASTAVGLGVGLGYSTFTAQGPMATGFDVRGNFALATSAGDREWASSEIAAQYNAGLPMGLVLAMQAEAGKIEGRNGDSVSIVDRAFIGNPMPRGFAYTGLGPRDFVEGSVDTALGGNEFVTSSIELRVATPNPDITVAGFADAGALWGLDEVTGGASGTIDDSYFLRTSVGLSLYWDSAFGLLQLNIAKPIDKRDTDQEERVSLNLNFQF
ncbi:BamA/TamA family outer membrane protein [Yoonia sp.]|uniref:BamA/TamA family outer membrane protein n=1 Tax=Yoonia sp. TaxID=2212373 RepID=UPI00358FCD8C